MLGACIAQRKTRKSDLKTKLLGALPLSEGSADIYIYIYVCVCVDALSIASGFDVANISTINSLSLRWTRLQLNPPGYYCTGRSVKILRAVVRLGKDDAGQAIVFMFYFLLSTIYWMLFVWLIFFRCFPDGRWFSEMSTLLAGSHL